MLSLIYMGSNDLTKDITINEKPFPVTPNFHDAIDGFILDNICPNIPKFISKAMKSGP